MWGLSAAASPMCLTQTLFVRHAGRHNKNAQAEIKQGRFSLQTHIKEGQILEGIKAGGAHWFSVTF